MPVHPNTLANLTPWTSQTAPRTGGRPIGASIRDHLNQIGKAMDTGDITVDDLRTIAKTHKNPLRMAAAIRILRMVETGDMADFAGLLRGENRLEDLRAMGVDTGLIKKIKQKTRKLPKGEELIEREIELHDRSGADFDRVINHTDGTPTQTINNIGNAGLPVPVILIELAHPDAAQLADTQPGRVSQPVISHMVDTSHVDESEPPSQPPAPPATPPPPDGPPAPPRRPDLSRPRKGWCDGTIHAAG